MRNKDYSGVILAGGLNSRYNGTDKAFIQVEGQNIIDRTLATYQDLFDEIIVVSNSPKHYAEGYQSIILTSDHYQGIGPLAGIHSAMKAATKPNLFIASCDMPWIQKDLVLLMIEEHTKLKKGNLIPMIDDKMEPLHAIYDCSTLNQLQYHIETSKKRSIRSYLEKVDTHYLTDPILLKFVKSFYNINSPEDFNKYVKG